jgi:type II secretion system protein J
MTHVKAMTLRYLDQAHQWQEQWPPGSAVIQKQEWTLRQRPLAVEITLDTDDWGRIVRIIEIAG